MLKNINITTATISDADEIAVMVGELLNEIMNKTGAQAFNFSLDADIPHPCYPELAYKRI